MNEVVSSGLTMNEVVSNGELIDSLRSAQCCEEHSFGMIGAISVVGYFSDSHFSNLCHPCFTFFGMNFATIWGTISGINSRKTIAEK